MKKDSKKTKVKKAKMAYEKAVKTSKPGEGKRFNALKNQLMAQGYSEKSASAIDASIGRKKYGAKKMSSMVSKSRKK